MPTIFAGLPVAEELAEEAVTALVTGKHVRIERIVSTGQASPEGFWYEQEWDEWVIVLRGGARLLFADEAEPISLNPGDWVHIAAHRRHRVAGTDPKQATVWLALHYEPDRSTPL